MKLAIFPSEQLGNEVQCLEQVQAGTLALTKVSAGVIGNFVSSYKAFGLPYLFRDGDHFWRALVGSAGREMLALLGTRDDGSPSGLRGLCFYDAGSRSFYAREPVRSPADLKGKKIRVMSDPVAMDIVLHPAARRVANLVTHALVFLFAASVMVYGGAAMFLDRWSAGQLMSALPVRKAWFYLALPVSGALIALFALDAAAMVIRGSGAEAPALAAEEEGR